MIRLAAVVGLCAAALAAGAGASAAPTTLAVTITDEYVQLAQTPIRVGEVVFKIANKSKVARDFRAGGKRTLKIPPGKSATLRVTYTKVGIAIYQSWGPPGTTPLSGVLTFVDPCTGTKRTAISVQMREGPMKLSRTSAPCGTVTFSITNTGTIVHSFRISGRQSGQLEPGQTATVTVTLTKRGRIYFLCGEPEHDEIYGETGWLTVV